MDFLKISNKTNEVEAEPERATSHSQESSVEELLSQTEALLDEAQEVLARLDESHSQQGNILWFIIPVKCRIDGKISDISQLLQNWCQALE